MKEQSQIKVTDPRMPVNSNQQVDTSKIASPALARLIEEVRNEEPSTVRAYNRQYNRHNR